MKIDIMKSTLKQLSAQRNGSLCVSLVLLIALLILSAALYREAGSTRFVLIPAGMRQIGWLDKRGVSKSYLVEMARYTTDLFLNTSPENSDYRMKTILQLTASQDRGAVKVLLQSQKTLLAKQDISTVFYPKKFIPEQHSYQVRVEGTLQRYVGRAPLPPLTKAYVLIFRYQNGLLLVSTFHEVVQTKS